MNISPHRIAPLAIASILLAAACSSGTATTTSAPRPVTTPATSTTAELVTTTSAEQISTTTTTIPGASLPLVAEEVVASDDGIFLVLHADGAPIVQVWDQPTALAFLMGEDFIVAQAAEVSDLYPRLPVGPIFVIDATGVRDLPGSAEERLQLFDATVIDGRAVALAVSGTGGAPEDTESHLLLIDVLTGERTDIAVVGGWEESVEQARFAGSRIVLELNGQHSDIEVRTLSGALEWAIPRAGEDEYPPYAIAATEERIALVRSAFTQPGDLPRLNIRRYDPATGDLLNDDTFALEPQPGVHVDGGFCFTAEWFGQALQCDQTYGGPLLIGMDGTTGYYPDLPAGVLTRPRPGPEPTCDLGEPNPSIAGDFDGDGLQDQAAYDVERNRLIVCTADFSASLPGSGLGEILEAVDFNQDGIDEILTGGTAAWGVGARLVTIAEDSPGYEEFVGYVKLPDESDLELWVGMPPDRFLTYGCTDFDDDGTREVAVIEGEVVSSTDATWQRTRYEIEGHLATPDRVDAGTFDPSSAGDPLSTGEIRSLRGGDC